MNCFCRERNFSGATVCALFICSALLLRQSTQEQKNVDYNNSQKRKGALLERQHAIETAAETRAFTDEERTEWDANDAELVALNGDIARLEKLREQERTMPAATPAAAPSPVTSIKEPPLYADLGSQLIDIRRAALGNDDARDRLLAAALGSNEAVDSDGGFLLMPDVVAGIERKMFTTGQILSRVRTIEVGPNSNGVVLKYIDETSRATGSRWGGVRAYWLDEADEKTASQPKFGRMEMRLKKIAALGYVTDELLQDSTVISSVYEDAFSSEIMFEVENAIINGDGLAKPLGILGHPATVSITKETSQTAATIRFENVLKMRGRLYGPSRGNAVWLISQEAEEVLPLMAMVVGTGGVPVYLPASGISQDGFDRLFGIPVIPVEYMPALGTVGDIMLVDLSQYIFIRKGGMQTASSIHVRFVTDETAFRVVYRCDGQPGWVSALTPANGTAGRTLSPYVTLATRA